MTLQLGKHQQQQPELRDCSSGIWQLMNEETRYRLLRDLPVSIPPPISAATLAEDWLQECTVPLTRVCVGETLLGTVGNLCEAFWHIRDTPEGSLPLTCLAPGPKKCSGKRVVLVARLCSQNGACRYTARYTNQLAPPRRHAEWFMVQDPELLLAVRECPYGSLTLYCTFQPCHFSGRFAADVSCTELLIDFEQRVLCPLRVRCAVRFSYPYRVHWQGDVVEEDTISIRNAQVGMSVLQQSSVRLEAFCNSDWDCILSLCNADVQREWRDRWRGTSQSFTKESCKARGDADQFVRWVIRSNPRWQRNDLIAWSHPEHPIRSKQQLEQNARHGEQEAGSIDRSRSRLAIQQRMVWGAQERTGSTAAHEGIPSTQQCNSTRGYL